MKRFASYHIKSKIETGNKTLIRAYRMSGFKTNYTDPLTGEKKENAYSPEAIESECLILIDRCPATDDYVNECLNEIHQAFHSEHNLTMIDRQDELNFFKRIKRFFKNLLKRLAW